MADFWHTFEELAAEIDGHTPSLTESRDKEATFILNWYTGARLLKNHDGRAIENVWRRLSTWWEKRTMNELIPGGESEKTKKIAPKAADALAFAKETEITCVEIYRIVATWLTGQKALRKEIDNAFDPGIEAQRHALDVLRGSKKEYTTALDEAEKIAKGKMAAFVEIQERAKAERERKLREEARKIAEAEKQAEVQRLLKANRVDAAAAVAAVPATPLAVIDSTPAVPKVDGISLRKDEVEWVIDDPALLPREYLKADEQKIGAVVRALGLEARIPGVSVKTKIGIAAGAR